MKFKILLILTLFFLNNCEQAKLNKSGDFKKIDTIKYRNSGFALIYDDNLKLKKKLDNRSLTILHSSLKKKSYVKITNPSNNKSIIVIHSKEDQHALKEIDASALAVVTENNQVVEILNYVVNGKLEN